MRFAGISSFVVVAGVVGAAACGGGGGEPDATGGGGGEAPSSGGALGTGGFVSTGGSGGSLGGAPELSGPIERDGLLVLEFEGRKLSVDPEHGGRIVSLSLGGTELLVQEDENEAFGSTFWTSPQSAWVWPPPSVVDSEPYEASVQVDSFSLASGESDATGEELVVTKDFSFDFPSKAFVVRYTIENRGDGDLMVAGWEVTRVKPDGLTFFLTGESEKKAPEHALLALDHDGDVSSFDHSAWTSGEGQKVNADGKGGFLAHAAGETLLVKSFSDVPLSAQHEEEGEIEIYADATGAFVEIENQGALETLTPGETLSYEVRYRLAPIPDGTEVSGSSVTLVNLAKSLAD